MATINGLCTLSEWKNYKASPGQPFTPDTTDDGVIEDLIEGASRYFEGECGGRTFYPRVETRSFDIPDGTPDDRMLWFNEDLLAVITFTNGDDTAIASTEYVLLPYNYYPKYALRLRAASSETWETDSSSNVEQVIDLLGYWGYHDQYTQRAWKSGGTLGAAMTDTTTLTLTMTAGHSIAAGQIIKIDNELLIVTTVATNTITANARGDNGSTAATHLINAVVYVWQVMDDVKQSVLEISRNAYSRRYGVNETGAAKVSPAGVVVGPADVSEFAARTMRRLRRVV